MIFLSVPLSWYLIQIEYGTMDGASRMVLVSGLSLPWGLTVYQGHLYYTDADYEVVERVDKESGGGLLVMRSGLAGLRALKVHARDGGSLLLSVLRLLRLARCLVLFVYHVLPSPPLFLFLLDSLMNKNIRCVLLIPDRKWRINICK